MAESQRDHLRVLKRDWMRRWRRDNPEANKAAQARAKGKYQASHARARLAWRKRNSDYWRQYMLDWERKQSREITLSYSIRKLKQDAPGLVIPIPLAQAHQANLKLKRLLWQHQKTSKN